MIGLESTNQIEEQPAITPSTGEESLDRRIG
jgi:hypothetical protein